MRFVGGSMHGALRVLRDEQYHRVPVYSHENVRYTTAAAEALTPGIRTETYERRPLVFDGFAKVYVMALTGMGQAEFMRRCADVIEGV